MRTCFQILLLAPMLVMAQTNRTDSLVSPEVHPDHRVTFRVRALKASAASLSGDWMPAGTELTMERSEQGVWSVTAGPLEPGIAIYTFTVDGITMADPVNPRLKVRARTSASLVDIPGIPPELWQARDVPHGIVEVNWEKSAVTGDTRAYYVYTPPGYDQNPSARYPVLYLLHGNNDTAAGWTDVGKANFIADNLLAEKKAPPMLIVMPWGHALPYAGPQGSNTVMVERYLMDEVIPQVERKYRVASGREHRAIAGLSMGGGHSLQIGLSHLDLFSSVSAFSAAVPANFENRFNSLLGDPAGTNAKLKLFWIGCGQEDSLFERSRNLSTILTTHKIQHTFRATPGLHNYALWRRCLVEIMPLIFDPGTGSK